MQPTNGSHRSIPVFVVMVVIAALIITAAGSFLAGLAVANSATLAHSGAAWTPFYQAWDTVENEFYYTKPSEAERIRGAIQGMLSTLNDKYTLFFAPDAAAADTQVMQGESGGIGARITVDKDGQIVIAEALIGKPAAEAGLQSGDVIRKVDDFDLKGVSATDAVKRVRGPIGTTVKLSIQRGDQQLEFTITRQQINVYGKILPDRIGYVSLALFDSKAGDQVRDALQPLLDQHPRALIFDLRGNPGGYLDQAVKVADLFLPEGVVLTEKTTLGENKTFPSKTGDLAEGVKLIVLVDHGSASASEIVSGALKDRGRAILIGQTTYGKGSVQTVHELSDKSQLRVTSGAWYTPNDTPIKNVGLTPNVYVTVPDVFPAGTDPILDTAVQYILKGGLETF